MTSLTGKLKQLKPTRKLPPRPANVFTTTEYEEAQGIVKTTALKNLQLLEKEGKVKRVKNIPVITSSDFVTYVTGWELVDARD